jgi:hypothetical protein
MIYLAMLSNLSLRLMALLSLILMPSLAMELQDNEVVTKPLLGTVVQRANEMIAVEHQRIDTLQLEVTELRKQLSTLNSRLPSGEFSPVEIAQRQDEMELNVKILMGKSPAFHNAIRVDMPLKIACSCFLVLLIGTGDIAWSSTLFLNIYFLMKIVFEKAVVIRNSLPNK